MESRYATHATLLAQLRDPNNEQAWQQFTATYQPFILGVALRMNLNRQDAEEVCQDILVKAWEKLPTFEYNPRRGRFRGWLCMLTGNAVRDRIRRENRRITDLKTGDSAAAGAPELTTPAAVEELALQEWKDYVTRQAWAKISGTFSETVKQAFLLVAAGHQADAIAAKLQISPSSVYVYKKRVQDALTAEIIRLDI